MHLLVAGRDRVDAGKTTFSLGLVHRIGAPGFKPRGANDYWFDHDDYRHAVTRGRLFGKDTRKLADASPDDSPPEARNPIHRLWRPATETRGTLLGQSGREFVLDRVEDEYVLNANAAVPASAREHLPLSSATRVSSVPELNETMERLHLPALDRVADRIRQSNRAVVESYGDVALPVQRVPVDAAAVVEPGRVTLYGGEAYRSACKRAASGGRGLETRSGPVLDRLDGGTTVSLPALVAAERRDPSVVADRYEVAYDALVAEAVG